MNCSADGAADLTRSTAVQLQSSDDPRRQRFSARLDMDWNHTYPSSGVLTTVALRAAQAALGDPLLRLVSCNTTFCAPVHPGPLGVDVTILRQLEPLAQVRVTVRNTYEPGHERRASEGLEILATFGRDRVGPELSTLRCPTVASATDAEAALDEHLANPFLRVPFWTQFDVRIADGVRPWQGPLEPGPAHTAHWLRYRIPTVREDDRFDALALPPLLDVIETALLRALGTTSYRFMSVCLESNLRVVDETSSSWLLAAAKIVRAQAGWAFATCELWDEQQRLVAQGSQVLQINGVRGIAPTRGALGDP